MSVNGSSPPALDVRDLRKAYPGDQFLLGVGDAGVSFKVEPGELFALLGPSGCGKSTTLRIIAGLLRADSGDVFIDGVRVTDRPAHSRPTNTVFQNYALFPHLTVGENVGFGLAVEGIGRRQRGPRVADMLDLVGLSGMESRRISELSGGQQQRTALARALVKRPRVVLLDEPFGSLDDRLRKHMHTELLRLKASTSTTFVHVTHDQAEACAIADRIAVMDRGRIIQIDEPYTLFRRPGSTYVASFVNAGTIIRGSSTREGHVVRIANSDVVVSGPCRGPLPDRPAAVIPPDRIRVLDADEPPDPGAVTGRVTRIVFTGAVFAVDVLVGARTSFLIHVSVAEMSTLELATGGEVALRWRQDDVLIVEQDD